MSQGGNSAVKDNDRGFSHILLDVYSIKQGALRIAVIPTASLLCLFVGLYLATSAVLNYNAEDSDQRDMITNMRLVLPARQAAHDKSQSVCQPGTVALGESGQRLSLERVYKSRPKLSDPRLLRYTEVLHPIVIMRDREVSWTYYETSDPTVVFPPFAWDAQLSVKVSFSLHADHVLQAVQIFNSWPVADRPVLSYKRVPDATIDSRRQVWSVGATFAARVQAYRIGYAPNGTLAVWHAHRLLVETRFEALDVPGTRSGADAASADYQGGRPELREAGGQSCAALFDADPACRDTIAVPRVDRVSVLEWRVAWRGAPADAWAAMRAGGAGAHAVLVEVRDLSQPRPYAPLMTAFGAPMFLGFALIVGALVLVLFWCGLRFHLININARENQGLPPMFYQGMRRFRGW